MTGIPGYKGKSEGVIHAGTALPRLLIGLFALFTFAVLFSALVLFYSQRSELFSEKGNYLESIGKVKSKQVSHWFKERMVEAEIIFSDAILLDELEKWFQSKDARTGADLNSWLSSLKKNPHYAKIVFITPSLQSAFSSETPSTAGPGFPGLAERALQKRGPVFFMNPSDGKVPLQNAGLLIPLFSRNDSLLGYVHIELNADFFIVPLLSTWYEKATTVETILIGLEHDSLINLSPLRFPQDSIVLKPFSTLVGNSLQVHNREFKAGLVSGSDYRGASVLAHIAKVEGAEWIIITKMDVAEITETTVYRGIWIGGIAFLCIILTGAILKWYMRKQKAVFDSNESEKRAIEKHYEDLITFANDIILLLNKNLEIVYANKKAVETYGYSADELLKLSIADIRSSDERAKTRLQFQQIDQLVSGIYETIHRRKDGVLIPVEVSVRKILLEGEYYYQGIIRDVTERKLFDKQIVQLNRIYSVLSNVNQAIVRARSKAELFEEVCRIAVVDGKFFAAWIGIGEGKDLRIADCCGLDREYLDSKIVSLIREAYERSLTSEVIETAQRRVINDVEAEVGNPDWRNLQLDLGIHSLVVYPLTIANGETGAFYLYCHEKHFFNDEELKLIDRLVMDIDFALESLTGEALRQEAEKAARKRGMEMEQLAKSTRSINTVLEKDTILRSLLVSAVEITDAASGAAGIVKDGRMVFSEFIVDGKTSPFPVKFEPSENEEIYYPRMAEGTHDPRSTVEFLAYEQLNKDTSRTVLINVSIVNRTGDRIGCFEVFNKKNGEQFSETDRILLEGLAASAAIALENTQMVEERLRAETALSVSESQMRATLENTPFVAIQWYDGNGRVLYWNAASETLFGWSAEESLGRTLDELILSGEDAKHFLHMIEKMGSDRTAQGPLELKVQKRDGSFAFILSTLFVIPGTGVKDVFVCMDIDITQAKLAEEKVKWNEARSQSLLKIYEYQAENVNELFAYALEEVVRLTQSKFGYFFLYDERVKEFTLNSFSSDTLKECMVQGAQSCYALDQTGLWGEAVRQRRDIIVNDFEAAYSLRKGLPGGHVRIKKFLTVPVFDNKRIVATVGVANKPADYDHFDAQAVKILMTAVWKIAQRSIDSEKVRKLSHIVEQSPVSILITNLRGEIEYANPKFCAVTGYEPREIIGRRPGLLKSGETPPEVYSHLWSVISSGNVWHGEFHNKKKNGDLFWELASISPVKDEYGNITHFVAVKEDITQLKQALLELVNAKEQAEGMNRLKSTFLANMSHELRTPMIGILGFTTALQEELNNPAHRDMVDIIHSSSTRLLETLDLILDLSKLEADKLDIATEEVDIVAYIKTLVPQFDKAAKRKNLAFDTELPLSPIYCRIDENMFRQIINNLINNAVKYTKEGGVFVTAYEDEQSRAAVIRVEDTGIGISAENQKVIWDEFRQVSDGMTRAFEGTGLGLSITKKFVEKLGGLIWVESEPGVGTTFICKFPLSLSGEKEPARAKKVENPSPASLSNEQRDILVVEDDRVSVELIRKFLPDNYNIESVRDGESALRVVQERKFDAILMDINLGRGMNGIEVTKRIRQIHEYYYVPIVAVTAYAMVGDKNEFLKAGCNQYISKPFGRKEFVQLIDNLFV